MVHMIGEAAARPGLKRQLGLVSAIALVAGEVIGVGIFLTPAEMSKSLGSPLLIASVWIIMGVLSILGALCYGELAARYPEDGGGYIYLREAYGPRIAFLYGWKCFLVMDPGLTAALAVGLASYAGYIVKLSGPESKALAIACILMIAASNIIGVKLGAFLLRWLTVLKLGLLLMVILWAVGFQRGDWSHFLPLAAQRSGSSPLGVALAGGFISAFFSLAGWWDVSKVTGEVRSPQKTLPRALLFGLLIVTAVYLATSAVFLYLVPMERVTSGETFAAQAGEVLFGRMGGLVFSAVVIISVFGSMAAFMMAAPRLYYAMARDGLFPASAASVHPRFGSPVRAIALQALVASILVMLGNFRSIVAYFIFITVAFVGLTVAGMVVIRKRSGPGSTYVVPGYPFTPLVFLVFIVLLLLVLALNNPQQALIGTAVVALGLPMYRFIAGPAAKIPPGAAETEETDTGV
jgi:APA family basic amino acid/polyamine antiporter